MSSPRAKMTDAIRELITSVTSFQDGSEELAKSFDAISPHLQNYNTAYRPTKKEIDGIVESLAEKFAFHGFLRQKHALLDQYRKLATEGASSTLSVIKLLIELADSPTNNVTKYTPTLRHEHEETIDWGSYLLEGVERWTPPPDDTSDSDEESFCESSDDKIGVSAAVQPEPDDGSGDANDDQVITVDEARSALRSSVQHGWFNSKRFRMKPRSDSAVANLAILWQKHLEKITRGLIATESPNIITEYHVMREILWQMFARHSSVCFRVVGDRIEVADDVTISSVRLPAFHSFLSTFIPYMDYFQALRKFSESLSFLNESKAPDTYRSYNCAVNMITMPMFDLFIDIEARVMKQEEIYTLLVLANELQPILPALKLLNDIQENVILDFTSNSAVVCATSLLSHLYKCLSDTKSKPEQDLYLTLYLQSLYKYFEIINSWLNSGELFDCVGEFVITDESDFSVKDLSATAREDPILSLICTQVLDIAKNIRLLRRLGKIMLFFEHTGNNKETFFDAFVKKMLEKIAVFFDVPLEEEEAAEPEEDASEFIFAGVHSDDCKYFTEMDKLENLVDTSDVFLMKAFEPYFVRKPEKKVVTKETLYRKIQKLTKTFLPIHSMLTGTFTEILDERYTQLGVMVKNVLVHDHKLEQHFEFLQHMFLFKEDMIFPFYRHLFDGMDSNSFVGNHAWLSSFLQDVIVDAYPKFYGKTSVELSNDWRFADDPLKLLEMINVKYRVEWPVNVIVGSEHLQMYRALFQFILKVKWALYSLNHMYFADLGTKRDARSVGSPTLTKLKMLRFGLLNVFNGIQHYILGHVFSEFAERFSKERENAFNLETLVKAHTNFISAIHSVCRDFQDYERNGHGLHLLLNLVRTLRLMWRNVGGVSYEELSSSEKSYWMCHKKLDEIMNTSRLVYDL